MIKLIKNPVIVIMLFLVMVALGWVLFFPRKGSVVERGRENELELSNEAAERVEQPVNEQRVEEQTPPTEVPHVEESEAGEGARVEEPKESPPQTNDRLGNPQDQNVTREEEEREPAPSPQESAPQEENEDED